MIVVGHYPVWSIAEHGPTKCLVDQLRPLLIQYKVTSYMCGHDHTFEYIQEELYPNLGYVVTGGTHVCDTSTEHSSKIPSGSLKFHGCQQGGFTRLAVNDTSMNIYYYYGNSTSHKHTVHLKPR